MEKNEREDFLDELGLGDIVEMQESLQEDLETNDDNVSIVDIPDSDTYSKVASKLEKSDLVKVDDESSQLTSDTASIQYTNPKYLLTLLADFAADTYKLTIKNMDGTQDEFNTNELFSEDDIEESYFAYLNRLED